MACGSCAAPRADSAIGRVVSDPRLDSALSPSVACKCRPSHRQAVIRCPRAPRCCVSSAHASLPRKRGEDPVAMSIPAKAWTLEELHRLPEDGNKYEVIRGELFVTPPPTIDHEEVLARLHHILAGYVEQHGVGRVYLSRAVIRFEVGGGAGLHGAPDRAERTRQCLGAAAPTAARGRSVVANDAPARSRQEARVLTRCRRSRILGARRRAARDPRHPTWGARRRRPRFTRLAHPAGDGVGARYRGAVRRTIVY